MSVMEMNTEEEEHMRELDEIYKAFPNAKFSIAIPFNEMDTIVSLKSEIFITHSRTCYCHRKPLDTQIFRINSINPITNRTILKQLISQNLDIKCSHHFVEGFDKLNENTFDIITGS